jgi:hypothetical protein
MVSLALSAQAYAFARVSAGSAVVVAFNSAAVPAEIEFDARPAHLSEGRILRERLAGGPAVRVSDGKIKATLPARSALLYAPEGTRP